MLSCSGCKGYGCWESCRPTWDSIDTTLLRKWGLIVPRVLLTIVYSRRESQRCNSANSLDPNDREWQRNQSPAVAALDRATSIRQQRLQSRLPPHLVCDGDRYAVNEISMFAGIQTDSHLIGNTLAVRERALRPGHIDARLTDRPRRSSRTGLSRDERASDVMINVSAWIAATREWIEHWTKCRQWTKERTTKRLCVNLTWDKVMRRMKWSRVRYLRNSNFTSWDVNDQR